MVDTVQTSASDWRKVLQQNKRRTHWVILTFLLIYAFVGLLFDTYFHMGLYPGLSAGQVMEMLVSFQILPTCTLMALAIAGICIFVTYASYDKLMLLGTEYVEITPQTARNLLDTQVYNVVEEMRIAAGLRFMPRVFMIEAGYMNAFASGFSESSAMIAITRGLAEKLDRAELQAVLAHELSHIRHLDIKLTLFAAVLSNLILMLIDMLFWSMLFGGGRRDERERGGNQLFLLVMVLRYALPLITLLLSMYLSRTREFMADSGAVELMRDNAPLGRALQKIHQDHVNNQGRYVRDYKATAHEGVRRSAYIYDPAQAGIGVGGSMSDLFSTHPQLKDRLQAIGIKL
jgi:heat shock protein HtpX